MKEQLSKGKIVIPKLHPLFLKSTDKIKGSWIKDRNKTRHTFSIFSTDK